MANPERELLAQMTSPDAMAVVIETGLDPQVFEDSVHRTVFMWMRDYWDEYQKSPTRMVMEHEFPTVRLPPVGEMEDVTTSYLVERLRERYVRNEVGELLFSTAKTLDEDPVASARTLIEDATEFLERVGRTPGDDGRPKLFNAADLQAAAQPRWLAKNRLPRAAVSLLVGDEGIGKSLLWVLLAAAVTTGKPMPAFGVPPRDPAPVFVVVTEDDWSTTVLPRLLVAGADIGMIRVICTDEDGSGAPEFPRDLDLITGADPAPALVVVDAWLDTVPAKLDIKNPQQARQALHPWKDVATRTDAAVWLLSHTNRVASDKPRDKYGATGELRKKARMTLFAQRDENGHLVVGPEKANTAAPVAASSFEIRPVNHFTATEDHDGTVPLLTYVGESTLTAQQHIAEAHAAGRTGSTGDEVANWLTAALANGPRWATDLYDAASEAGFSTDQLKRNKRRAGAE